MWSHLSKKSAIIVTHDLEKPVLNDIFAIFFIDAFTNHVRLAATNTSKICKRAVPVAIVLVGV